MVREGESVTHNGVVISLAKSLTQGDIVSVRRSSEAAQEFSLEGNGRDETSSPDQFIELWGRTEASQSHCICCGCTPQPGLD